MSLKLEENNGDNGFELVDRPKEGDSTLLVTSPAAAAPLFFSTSTPLSLPTPILLPAAQYQATANPTAPATVSFSTISPIQPMAPPAPLFFPAPASTAESLVKPSSFELPIMQAPVPAVVSGEPCVAGPNLEEPSKAAGGLFGWMSGLPGKGILSKVAEKARSSVDTLVTTLDPQMKEFIYSGGDIEIVVASAKESKVGAVREAFQGIFGKATVRGLESQSTSSAAQPVGFPSALQAAEDRIILLRSSGQVHPQLPVIAVEGFVVELYANNWFEMGCLLLDDPSRNLRLNAFTQPLPVPTNVVTRMQNQTSAGYPHRQSGFAITVGQAIEEEYKVPSDNWQSTLHGTSRRELIILAAKSLAFAYKTSRGHQL